MMHYYTGSIPDIWQAVVSDIVNNPGKESRCVVMESRIDQGLSEPHDGTVRRRLDNYLQDNGKPLTHTVANTIFPNSLWNRNRPRADLFARYENIWPKLQKTPANRNGVYFRRMIAYAAKGSNPVNQLNGIIESYLEGNHRRSAGSISIYDPSRDLVKSRQRGFPCLQHVSATPNGEKLSVTGTYIMQHAVPKLYGNLIGLYNLGFFLAREMGLELEAVQCFAQYEVLGSTKADAKSILGEETV